jgi:sugar phosphate isomerase/epimerase
MLLSFLINVGHFSDVPAARRLAEEKGLGLEIQHFADGATLDGAWRDRVAALRTELAGFNGTLSMHGPFDGLDPGAWDPQVRAASRGRYLHALQIADRLNARTIVFHNGYSPVLRYHGGVPRWVERRAPAWGDLACAAEKYGLRLVLENVWEPDPEAQLALLRAVASPYLQACLDIGHAHMTAGIPVVEWVERMGVHLAYVHAHSNSGASDDHWPLGQGTLDVWAVLAALERSPGAPRVCLELKNSADQLATLAFLGR